MSELKSKKPLPVLRNMILTFILGILTLIMIKTILQYRFFDSGTGFLQFKQTLTGNRIWMTAFYIHVFSCVCCLLAGLTQFSKYILNHMRPLHKFMGRFYVYNILLINFPMAMILAVHANGGLSSKLAFMILDLLWFSFTLLAVTSIRKGDIQKHRAFMIRSFALTLSALSFRLWKQFFVNFTDLDPAIIYQIDAWMGFVPNLIIAEILIYKIRIRSALKRSTTLQNISGQ